MTRLLTRLIFLTLLLLSSACAVTSPICVKDRAAFCKTEGNFTGQWYDYYERALSCMEGGCYDSALADLNEAVRRRFEDKRKVRTYGRRYVDYFPHREIGLIHYLEGRYDLAEAELTLSLAQYPSAKASYYLDKVRIRVFEIERRTLVNPALIISSPAPASEGDEIWLADDPVKIAGLAKDETQFVSKIRVADEPVYIEASVPSVSFQKELFLDQGRHVIPVAVNNLMGGETRQNLIIYIDRLGPVIAVTEFVQGNFIRGSVSDDSDKITLFVNHRKIAEFHEKESEFLVELGSEDQIVLISAKDRLNNESRIQIHPDIQASSSKSVLVADNSGQVAADSSNFFSGAAKSRPEIIVHDFMDHDTVFKDSVRVSGEIRSPVPVEWIEINGTRTYPKTGTMVSFNSYCRLVRGDNNIIILVKDQSGDLAEKEIVIHRKDPQIYLLSSRHHLAVYPFETFGASADSGGFWQHLIKDMTDRKRFRITVKEAFSDSLQPDRLLSGTDESNQPVHSALLGNMYVTKNGIEIAIRLEDIETGVIMAVSDVYREFGGNFSSQTMAAELSDKFHRKIPIMDGTLARISEGRIFAVADKWIPDKGKIIKRWQFLLYRYIRPDDRVRGSDAEIICDTASYENPETDQTLIFRIEKNDVNRLQLTDRIISR